MKSEPFGSLEAARARGQARGLYSVCSSNALVLEAAARRAAASGLPLLAEATANQVNQEGGYTGMRPADFAAKLAALRAKYGLREDLLVFGGDHLGPYPWRSLRSEEAMAKAETLVRDFVAAGARKLHLDASMALGGETGPRSSETAPTPEIAAARAVRLCAAAEEAFRAHRPSSSDLSPPVYVIGSEVPVPGGAVAEEDGGPAPTSAESFLATMDLHERLFAEAGLEDAWRRVVAVVVQPGVEFDSSGVTAYRRERARGLVAALKAKPGLLFEAHSTDYQSDESLRELVEDGFALLKVGPALSFALREALIGLGCVEAELAGEGKGNRLAAALSREMRADDRYWRGYYSRGDGPELSFSLSDRARYYWDTPGLAAEVERLFASLDGRRAPPGLLSQYLPRLGGPQGALARAGRGIEARELALAAVDAELARYETACFPERSRDRAGAARRGAAQCLPAASGSRRDGRRRIEGGAPAGLA